MNKFSFYTAVTFLVIIILAGCRNPSGVEYDASGKNNNEAKTQEDSMAVWQEPKTDWTVADSPKTTDVNRWEGNVDYLCPINISGNVGSDMSIPDGESRVVQQFYCKIPPRSKVHLRMLNYWITHSDLRLKINMIGGAPSNVEYNYTTTNYRDQIEMDIDCGIVNNETAEDDLLVMVSVTNNSGATHTLDRYTSWFIRIAFVGID
jgi:hypothetical protein